MSTEQVTTESKPDVIPDETPDGWTSEIGLLAFPFVEDEDGNLTGYGHQDKTVFAESVATYDESMGWEPEGVGTSADDVTHQWVRFQDGSDELLQECDQADAGAFPVTAVWYR